MELALLIGRILIELGPTIAQGYQLIASKLVAGQEVSQQEWDVFWKLAQESWVDIKPEEAKPV